jgi:hypothetical protein
MTGWEDRRDRRHRATSPGSGKVKTIPLTLIIRIYSDRETDRRRRFPQTFFKIVWIPRIARDEEKELKPTPNWDDWDRMG